MEEGPSEVVYARKLASSDENERNKNIKNLKNYLKSLKSIEFIDMMKLWKGIFYALWNADKVPYQNDVIMKIADIIMSIDNESVAFMYIECFFATMAREWTNVDRFRVNKYYNLFKGVLYESAVYITKVNNQTCFDQYIKLLAKYPFNVIDQGAIYPICLSNFLLENINDIFFSSSKECVCIKNESFINQLITIIIEFSLYTNDDHLSLTSQRTILDISKQLLTFPGYMENVLNILSNCKSTCISKELLNKKRKKIFDSINKGLRIISNMNNSSYPIEQSSH